MAITPIEFAKTTTAETGIDYSALSESIFEGLEAGMTAIKEKRGDLAEAQTEIETIYDQNMLEAAQNGDYLNERVVKFGEEGSLMLQKINNAYRRNEITRDVWLRQKNNIINGGKQIGDFINLFSSEQEEFNKRMASGSLNPTTGLTLASALDVYNQNKLGPITQLKGHGFFLGSDGKAFFGKYDKNGKISGKLGDFLTLPAALSGVSQKYDNYDLSKNSDYLAKVIAPYIEVEMRNNVKTKEDAFQSQDVQDMIQNEWKRIEQMPEALISIITEQGVADAKGGLMWGITEDVEEAKNDPSKILVTVSDQTNRYIPITEGEGSSNYTDAIDKAKDVFYKQIRSRVGVKETAMAQTKPTAKTAATYDEEARQRNLKSDLISVMEAMGPGAISQKVTDGAIDRLRGRRIEGGKDMSGFSTKSLSSQYDPNTKKNVLTFESEYTNETPFGDKERKEAKQLNFDFSYGGGKTTAADLKRNTLSIISAIYGYTPGNKIVNEAFKEFSEKHADTWDKTYTVKNNYISTQKASGDAKEFKDISNIKIGGMQISPVEMIFTPEELTKEKVARSLPELSQQVKGGLGARGFGEFVLDGNNLVFTVAKDGITKAYKIKTPIEQTIDGETKIVIPGGTIENVYNQIASGNAPDALQDVVVIDTETFNAEQARKKYNY